MTIVEMEVNVDCPGCEAKIKKALRKLDGVHEVDIDMDMQKVTVMGWADQEKVLKAVRKTGKKAELWSYTPNPEYYNFNHYYSSNYYNKQEQRYYSYDQQPQTVTHYYATPSNSSYNYEKHGYSGESYGCYHRPPPYATIVKEPAGYAFSDENPHACSIM